VWAVISYLVYVNCISEITINKADRIYSHLMAFLLDQDKFKSSRKLIAETVSKSTWELDRENIKTKELRVDVVVEGDIKWLNFARQEAKSKPRFIPAIRSYSFWYSGTYFQLKRKEVAMFDELSSRAATFKDKEILNEILSSKDPRDQKDLARKVKNFDAAIWEKEREEIVYKGCYL